MTASESDASVSFNRLFSRFCYTSLQDNFADLSNFWQIRLGAKAQFTDSISLRAQVAYFGVVDEFHHLPDFQLGPFAVPIAPALSFWTEETDDDFAIITKMWLRYDYSEDLWFMLV